MRPHRGTGICRVRTSCIQEEEAAQRKNALTPSPSFLISAVVCIRFVCAGSVHPFAEHVLYTAIFAIPMLGTWLLGGASIATFYVYWLGFDFLNAIGHCNFEFVPSWLYEAIPGLKYLLYTPS